MRYQHQSAFLNDCEITFDITTQTIYKRKIFPKKENLLSKVLVIIQKLDLLS